MSGRVFQVSKEAQQRDRLADLRRELDAVEVPAPDDTPSEPDHQTLESLVESELKKQLRSLQGRELGLAIMNAIKFLAVRAKIPLAFGSELDEPTNPP